MKKQRFQPWKLVLTILIALCVIAAIVIGYLVITNPYDNANNWVYQQSDAANEADVFLVGETVIGKNDGNMSISNKDDRASYRQAVADDSKMFAQSCNIYAPYYKQADQSAVEKGIRNNGDLDSAYKSVKRAFKKYLESAKDGQPIILAGFEQGGEMVLRLLKDYYQDSDNQKNLIAAYVIDWEVDESYLGGSNSVQLSQSSADVGVIVTKKEDIETRMVSYFRKSITTQSEFVDALGGLDMASARDNVITLKADITLDATLVIADGTYTILGNGHTITRNADHDMISLISEKDSNPQLILGKKDGSDELILDGNSTEFGNTEGAIVGLYGNVKLSVYDGVTLKNNSRVGYDGGAVYGECAFVENADGNYECYEPSVNIFGGLFQQNSTDKNGGAIAIIGSYSSTEDKYFGNISLFAGTFEENTAANGNQVYCANGNCAYARKMGFGDGDLLVELG